jgi:hypothetical protein
MHVGGAAAELEAEFDYAAVLIDESGPSEAVLMTTSHDDESLEEALWFAVHCAFPDTPYEESCRDVVVIAVAEPAWEQRMNAYLTMGAPLQEDFD